MEMAKTSLDLCDRISHRNNLRWVKKTNYNKQLINKIWDLFFFRNEKVTQNYNLNTKFLVEPMIKRFCLKKIFSFF